MIWTDAPFDRRMVSTAFLLAVRQRITLDREMNTILLDQRASDDMHRWLQGISSNQLPS